MASPDAEPTHEYDPERIFRHLHEAGVRYVTVGGWAVNAHGHRRFTADVGICPDPAPDNLDRLARLLADLHARRLGSNEFDVHELPGDPTDPASLADGGNFRLETDAGMLDVMQWLAADDGEVGCARLRHDAIDAAAFGTPVTICSLPALLAMKRAAGRPQDLADVAALETLESD